MFQNYIGIIGNMFCNILSSSIEVKFINGRFKNDTLTNIDLLKYWIYLIHNMKNILNVFSYRSYIWKSIKHGKTGRIGLSV